MRRNLTTAQKAVWNHYKEMLHDLCTYCPEKSAEEKIQTAKSSLDQRTIGHMSMSTGIPYNDLKDAVILLRDEFEKWAAQELDINPNTDSYE